MSGVALNINFRGIERLQNRINQLGELDRHDLLDAVGAELEAQTHSRLRDEKSDPDGTPWVPLSDEWATRKREGFNIEGVRFASSGGILDFQGDLDKTIQSLVGGDGVETGSNLVYAATHQFGDDERNIVAREYLGLSDDNWGDIAAVVDDFLDNFIQGVTQ